MMPLDRCPDTATLKIPNLCLRPSCCPDTRFSSVSQHSEPAGRLLDLLGRRLPRGAGVLRFELDQVQLSSAQVLSSGAHDLSALRCQHFPNLHHCPHLSSELQIQNPRHLLTDRSGSTPLHARSFSKAPCVPTNGATMHPGRNLGSSWIHSPIPVPTPIIDHEPQWPPPLRCSVTRPLLSTSTATTLVQATFLSSLRAPSRSGCPHHFPTHAPRLLLHSSLERLLGPLGSRTKRHRLNGFNNRSLFSHSSGG